MYYVQLPAASAAKSFFLTALVPLLMVVCLIGMPGIATPARATDLPIYTDSMQNGFQDWSWATHNLTNTSPVQSGSDSISVTYGSYTGVYFHSGSLNTANYTALSFWVNGGGSGGQRFTVAALNGNGAAYTSVPVTNYVSGGAIPANTWVQVKIPFSDLGITNTTNFGGFWMIDSTGGAQPTMYLDTITMIGLSAPAVVHVSVTASQTLQTVDSRDFGLNTAIWDGNLGTSTTDSLMNAAGAGVFRFPGGSASDGYDWTVQQYNGQTVTPTFGTLTDATGAQAIITANYGTGTPQMAAAWVAYCNATTANTVAIGMDSAGRDWKTAAYWAALRGATPLSTNDGLNFLRVNHPAPYGFKNWEIGNECYGSWETDNHSAKQDPVIYANAAKAMTALMKQVDPTLQIGVVVTMTEDDAGNQTETVTNPVTGVQHRGWTAVLFSTLNSIGYTPDYVIYHNYAQSPGGENDAVLLQYSGSWTGDAASIRTMLTQYLGATRSGPVRLVATENNSVYGNPGKQSTSLVNGLFYADSIGSLMQTEFKGLVWWDLRNGQDASQNNSPNLYGWRLYGDYGVLGSAGVQPGGSQNTPYPTYFALKLASKFARGGDTIVPASSDYTGLSVYACKRANGDLCLLVVNKNPTTDLNATITLNGFTPASTATVYEYGKSEDQAQSGGANVDLTQSSLAGLTTTFSETFPSYSMTVVHLAQGAHWLAQDVAGASDGTARVLWTHGGGLAGLWSFGANDLEKTIGPTYGPYSDSHGTWSAKAIAVAADGTTRMLWDRSDGAAGVWTMSAAGTQTAVGPVYVPSTGWSATDIATAPNGTSRVLWVNTNGAAGVWTVNAGGTATTLGPTIGPFAGWTATAVGAAGDGTARILWTKSDGTAGLWTLNASNAGTTAGPTYGPFSDTHGTWKATDMGTSADGTSQVLWTRSDGAAGIWAFNALDVDTTVGPTYGPTIGYAATALGSASDKSCLLWLRSDNAAGLWSFGANGAESVIGSVYGPF